MSVKERKRTWLEVEQVGTGRPVRFSVETVDLADGSPLVPAVKFGAPPNPYPMQTWGQVQRSPQYLVSVEDLREIVRLADESVK